MWLLRLYVSYDDPLSAHALLAVRELCDQEGAYGCKLQVVELHSQYSLAAQDGVDTTPTLVKLSPPPVQKIVPVVWDVKSVAAALDWPPKG